MKLVGKPRLVEITENDELLFTIGGRPIGYNNGRLLWCFTDIERLNQIKKAKVAITSDDSILFSLGFEPTVVGPEALKWDDIALECLEDYHTDTCHAKEA
ncbi:MAG: hypothetical protein ACOH5I_20115 [Oligoflexus sp.]